MIGLTGLFRTEASENCPDPELTGFFNPYNSTIMGLVKPESVLPGCTDPGLLETFLFGSLIAAVDPVAVLAVFDEIKVRVIKYIEKKRAEYCRLMKFSTLWFLENLY